MARKTVRARLGAVRQILKLSLSDVEGREAKQGDFDKVLHCFELGLQKEKLRVLCERERKKKTMICIIFIDRLSMLLARDQAWAYAKLKNQKGATADGESFDSQAHEYVLPRVSMLGKKVETMICTCLLIFITSRARGLLSFVYLFLPCAV